MDRPEELDNVVVREERPDDVLAVSTVHELAFGGLDEARIVDAVRRAGEASLSLVAVVDDRVVGHVLFSPVTVDGSPAPSGLGLAPMAVHPEFQRRRIGTRLLRASLERCRAMSTCFVAVVGHPEYYRRFGFRRASGVGLRYEHPVPDEAFMVLEVEPGCLSRISGVVRYVPAFSEA